MTVTEFLELFLVGLGAGAMGGLLGIGGGVILVPGLALVLGIPFRAAVAASLVCIVATAVASSIVHLPRARVELGLALDLEAFTVAGAIVGGLTAAWIPSGPLLLAFAIILVVVAVRMWPRPSTATSSRESAPQRPGWARAASVGAGVVSSLLGVGGGIFKVPVLHVMLGLDFDRAAATSIYMIGITAAAGAMMYVVRGDVDYHLTGAAVMGTLLGSGVAALYGHRINARWLKVLFSIVLLYVAAQMVRRGAGQL